MGRTMKLFLLSVLLVPATLAADVAGGSCAPGEDSYHETSLVQVKSSVIPADKRRQQTQPDLAHQDQASHAVEPASNAAADLDARDSKAEDSTSAIGSKSTSTSHAGDSKDDKDPHPLSRKVAGWVPPRQPSPPASLPPSLIQHADDNDDDVDEGTGAQLHPSSLTRAKTCREGLEALLGSGDVTLSCSEGNCQIDDWRPRKHFTLEQLAEARPGCELTRIAVDTTFMMKQRDDMMKQKQEARKQEKQEKELMVFGEITGDIAALSAMTQMTYINLAGTSVHGLFSAISSMAQLTHIHLSGTEVDTKLAVLSRMTQLTYINLKQTWATGDISALSQLTKLEQLTLPRSSGIVDHLLSGDIKSLASLTKLKKLDLDSGVEGDIESLSSLANLEVLEISGIPGSSNSAHLISGDIKSLSPLTKLIKLGLPHTHVSGRMMHLAGLTALDDVDLSGTRVTGSCLELVKMSGWCHAGYTGSVRTEMSPSLGKPVRHPGELSLVQFGALKDLVDAMDPAVAKMDLALELGGPSRVMQNDLIKYMQTLKVITDMDGQKPVAAPLQGLPGGGGKKTTRAFQGERIPRFPRPVA